MSGTVYPAEMRVRARALYRPGVYGYNQVARELGIPSATIVRWVNEQSAERSRAICRRNKRRYRGTCVDCGASTSYSGVGTRGSLRCVRCAKVAARFWTRERIIRAIQRWADEHGRAPTSIDWRKTVADESHPSATAVYSGGGSVFSSWADAIEAAGFPRPYSPPGAGNRLFDRVEAQAFRSQGMPVREIATRYGVTPNAIYKATRRAA